MDRRRQTASGHLQTIGSHKKALTESGGKFIRGAEKGIDAQMPLDPFEEQLDLPAAFIKLRDGQRRPAALSAAREQMRRKSLLLLRRMTKNAPAKK